MKFSRIIAAIALALFAVFLAAASPDVAGASADCASGVPTKFDFLVLASIADSQQPLAMAGYYLAHKKGSSPCHL